MWTILVLAIAVQASSNDRPDLRGEIHLFNGASGPIHVAPSGDLWLGSRNGHLFVSHDRARTWSEVETPAAKSDTNQGDDLGRIAFHDERRGLIAGWKMGREGWCLRTADAGATWKRIELPYGVPAIGLQARSDGEAWLGGERWIHHSTDFGETWRPMTSSSKSGFRCEAFDLIGSPRGVVASAERGIELTEDGGKSWRTIPAPERSLVVREEGAEPPESDGPLDKIDRVLLLGDRVIVEEEFEEPDRDRRREFLVAQIHGPTRWSSLRVDGHAVLEMARHPGGLVVVTDDLRVAILSKDVELEKFVPGSLESGPICRCVPMAVESGPAGIVVFDGSAHVAVVDSDGFRLEHLFTAEEHASWPIVQQGQAESGEVLGISRRFLYRAVDGGKAWERLTEIPRSSQELYVPARGDAWIGGGPGGYFHWRERERRLEKVSGLEQFHKNGLRRDGDFWFLYGVLASDERVAQRVLRTSDTLWIADSFTGIVFASGDAGETWSVLDRWPGGAVEAIELTESGWFSLYRAGGGIRCGPLLRPGSAPPAADLKTVVEPGPPWEGRTNWPFVEYDIRIHFDDPLHGSVTGGMFFEGRRSFRTEDGGRTWTRGESTDSK